MAAGIGQCGGIREDPQRLRPPQSLSHMAVSGTELAKWASDRDGLAYVQIPRKDFNVDKGSLMI